MRTRTHAHAATHLVQQVPRPEQQAPLRTAAHNREGRRRQLAALVRAAAPVDVRVGVGCAVDEAAARAIRAGAGGGKGAAELRRARGKGGGEGGEGAGFRQQQARACAAGQQRWVGRACAGCAAAPCCAAAQARPLTSVLYLGCRGTGRSSSRPCANCGRRRRGGSGWHGVMSRGPRHMAMGCFKATGRTGRAVHTSHLALAAIPARPRVQPASAQLRLRLCMRWWWWQLGGACRCVPQAAAAWSGG